MAENEEKWTHTGYEEILREEDLAKKYVRVETLYQNIIYQIYRGTVGSMEEHTERKSNSMSDLRRKEFPKVQWKLTELSEATRNMRIRIDSRRSPVIQIYGYMYNIYIYIYIYIYTI